MSNRELTPEAKELVDSHEAQIRALTEPGLSDEQRVRMFGEAAGLESNTIGCAVRRLEIRSPAMSVWVFGEFERSLFGNLPECSCPVMEIVSGRKTFPGIPSYFPSSSWSPDATTLRAFARGQQEARLGFAVTLP